MNWSIGNRILIVLAFFLLAFVQKDVKVTQWEIVKKRNNITVSSRENSLSEVKEIRAETTINTSLSSLVYLIKHIEKQTEWAYAIMEAKVVRKYSNFHWVAYTMTDAPWPVDDRDCVTDVAMRQFSDSSIYINSYEVDSIIKPKKDVVRIPMIKAHWLLTPISAHKTRVRFQILLELGGSVPSWVVNLFIETGPYNTLRDFKEEVEKEKYQKIKLPYIKQP